MRTAESHVRTALIGLVVLALVFVTALNLPVIGDGTTHAAEFTEAAGLRTGNDMRIAGVKVGRVSAIGLNRAGFLRGQGRWLGDTAGAAIKLKTVLGQKYLALDPEGSGTLDPDQPIPSSRTTVP